MRLDVTQVVLKWGGGGDKSEFHENVFDKFDWDTHAYVIRIRE